jgi:hypothetical protein
LHNYVFSVFAARLERSSFGKLSLSKFPQKAGAEGGNSCPNKQIFINFSILPEHHTPELGSFYVELLCAFLKIWKTSKSLPNNRFGFCSPFFLNFF